MDLIVWWVVKSNWKRNLWSNFGWKWKWKFIGRICKRNRFEPPLKIDLWLHLSLKKINDSSKMYPSKTCDRISTYLYDFSLLKSCFLLFYVDSNSIWSFSFNFLKIFIEFELFRIWHLNDLAKIKTLTVKG